RPVAQAVRLGRRDLQGQRLLPHGLPRVVQLQRLVVQRLVVQRLVEQQLVEQVQRQVELFIVLPLVQFERCVQGLLNIARGADSFATGGRRSGELSTTTGLSTGDARTGVISARRSITCEACLTSLASLAPCFRG